VSGNERLELIGANNALGLLKEESQTACRFQVRIFKIRNMDHRPSMIQLRRWMCPGRLPNPTARLVFFQPKALGPVKMSGGHLYPVFAAGISRGRFIFGERVTRQDGIVFRKHENLIRILQAAPCGC